MVVGLAPWWMGQTEWTSLLTQGELNAHMGAFIVAPLTPSGHPYPFRVACTFQGKDGHIVPDQLRTVDREWLVKRLGVLPQTTLLQVLNALQAMFAA
jgi:mRNA interferase MazF